MADKPNVPNVGPEPVEAEPNHVREKTYREPDMPKNVEDELHKLPEEQAKQTVREELPSAVDGVKERL